MSQISTTWQQRTLVVGAGVTGLSVVRHLQGQDALTLVDTRGPEAFSAAQIADYAGVQLLLQADRSTLESQLAALAGQFDRAVLSPGLKEDHWLVQAVRTMGIPTCTDIDLFFDAVQVPVIGITGTNGKSTVTSLVAELLNAAGVTAAAGGNLGPAALDLLTRPAQIYVLELSSFQLARSRVAPYRVACILNIRPDHIDYHGTMAQYLAAKQRIYGAAQQAVFCRDDADSAPSGAAPGTTSFGLDAPAAGELGIVLQGSQRWLAAVRAADGQQQLILPCAELTIAGRHNESNALAALAIVRTFLPDAGTIPALAAALRAYAGLPHRCERVAQKNGVTFINDSKATNIGATMAAVEGLRSETGARLLLLLGGQGKGADFRSLRPVVTSGVGAVYVFGADAEALYQALWDVVPTHRCATLTAAMDCAWAAAKPGDSVLLSPACASLDQFANFEARGDAFRRRALELAA